MIPVPQFGIVGGDFVARKLGLLEGQAVRSRCGDCADVGDMSLGSSCISSIRDISICGRSLRGSTVFYSSSAWKNSVSGSFCMPSLQFLGLEKLRRCIRQSTPIPSRLGKKYRVKDEPLIYQSQVLPLRFVDALFHRVSMSSRPQQLVAFFLPLQVFPVRFVDALFQGDRRGGERNRGGRVVPQTPVLAEEKVPQRRQSFAGSMSPAPVGEAYSGQQQSRQSYAFVLY